MLQMRILSVGDCRQIHIEFAVDTHLGIGIAGIVVALGRDWLEGLRLMKCR